MKQFALQDKTMAATAKPALSGAASGQSLKDATLRQEVPFAGTNGKEVPVETPAPVGGHQARPGQLRLVAPVGRRLESQDRQRHTNTNANRAQVKRKGSSGNTSSLLLGAGFTLASLIILPAVAQHIGMGSSLTSALRVALMRAANRF